MYQVALEACVQAGNEGCHFAPESNEIIPEFSKWSLELVAASEIWKEIKFEKQGMQRIYCNETLPNFFIKELNPIQYYNIKILIIYILVLFRIGIET